MSKHVNMTGHYKVAGRERQGEDILQSSHKGTFAQQRQQARREAIESQAGPPAWETTPPNFETAKASTRTAPKSRKAASGTRKASRPRTAKRARKVAPARQVARATARPRRRQSKST